MRKAEAGAIPPPLPPEATQKDADIVSLQAKREAADIVAALEASLIEQTNKLNEIRTSAQKAWKAAKDAGMSDEAAEQAMENYRQALLAGAEEVRVRFNTPKGPVDETLIIPPRQES